MQTIGTDRPAWIVRERSRSLRCRHCNMSTGDEHEHAFVDEHARCTVASVPPWIAGACPCGGCNAVKIEGHELRVEREEESPGVVVLDEDETHMIVAQRHSNGGVIIALREKSSGKTISGLFVRNVETLRALLGRTGTPS